MEKNEPGGGMGKTIVKGIAQHHTSRIKERVEKSTIDFRVQAGRKIEDFAEQIRLLGSRFENADEAHLLARRLEKMADYLRFRPSPEIASDVLATARRYHALWIAGGVLGTVILYRLLRRPKS